MEQNNPPSQPPVRPRHREWTGIFLVIIGGLLLAHKLYPNMPDWIFTWPTLLIGIGLLNGFQHNFRNPLWFILLIIGGAFLIDQQFERLNLHELIWPGILILVGFMFLMRRRDQFGNPEWKTKMEERFGNNWRDAPGGKWGGEWKKDWKGDWEKWNKKYETGQNQGDYIDSTNVFGGTKKVVLSKNFRGGDITCFFGGAEIDFTQADIQSPVILDVTMVFGGIKITVPSHWDIKNQITPVFGGIEDKRTVAVTNYDPNKTLVLTGTAVFAGIEIRNY